MVEHNRPDLIEQRESHYQRFLGPITGDIAHSTDAKRVHIDIYTFPPTKERPYYTLITGGMSDLRQNIPEGANCSPRAELMLYAREPKPWMYDVLKGLAEMPSDDETFLSYMHTVPNGQPMTAEPSLLTSYFFMPPVTEPDEFGTMTVDGDDTGILLLVPITEGEREFAMSQGSIELAQTIEQNVDLVIDEHRACIISGAKSPGGRPATPPETTYSNELAEQIREAVIERARKRWERVTSPSVLGKLLKPIFGGNLEAVLVIEDSQADPKALICGGDALAAWIFDKGGFRQIDPAEADPGAVSGSKWKRHVLRFCIEPDGEHVVANELEGPQVGSLLRFKVKPTSTGVKLAVRGTSLGF